MPFRRLAGPAGGSCPTIDHADLPAAYFQFAGRQPGDIRRTPAAIPGTLVGLLELTQTAAVRNPAIRWRADNRRAGPHGIAGRRRP